jgi:adenylosuccinate synthase
LDGRRIETLPSRASDLERCVPVYEDVPGWQCDTTGVTDAADLPKATLDYIARLEELTGVKAGLLSVGPARSSTLRVGL